jgi:hypothetical protein
MILNNEFKCCGEEKETPAGYERRYCRAAVLALLFSEFHLRKWIRDGDVPQPKERVTDKPCA